MGTRCVFRSNLLEGGSILDDVFQRVRLADELSLVMDPVIGGAGDKSLFDSGRVENYRLSELRNNDEILCLNYKSNR